METWTRTDLEHMQQSKRRYYVYFFTPMCGACQLAGQLLTILEQADNWDKTVAKIDLNFVPDLAEKWQISSVPVLVAYQGKHITAISYELNNVSSIYEFFQRG